MQTENTEKKNKKEQFDYLAFLATEQVTPIAFKFES
jgi:hypothetical protein